MTRSSLGWLSAAVTGLFSWRPLFSRRLAAQKLTLAGTRRRLTVIAPVQQKGALKKIRSRIAFPLTAGTVIVTIAALAPVAQAAAARPVAPPASQAQMPSATGHGQPPARPRPSRLTSPGKTLPRGWQTSADRAVTVAGDAAGLHVLAASEQSGYAWRTVTTLGAPQVQTSEWIGQACVTGSGRRAVVVYAPREVTNLAGQQGRLARGAIVDLDTDEVTPLGGGFSMAYFDPGCGTGEQVALTRGGWGDGPGEATTTVAVVNAASGRTMWSASEPGQVTSAVPYHGQVAASYGHGVSVIGPGGKVRTLASSVGAPFRLAPDVDGSLAFETMHGRQVQLRQYTGGAAKVVATVRPGAAELSQVAGRVFVTGQNVARLGSLPRSWLAVRAPATAQVSTHGQLAVTAAVTAASGAGQPRAERTTPQPGGGGFAQPVSISAVVPATGKQPTFEVSPAGKASMPASPAAAATGTTASGGQSPQVSPRLDAVTLPDPSTETDDPNRSCSIPRNNTQYQAYQPSAQQVEWAVDQAVDGTLTGSRPANLFGSGIAAYTPQGLFPAPGLTGGGTTPPQVLLGVLTQESNLEQAEPGAIIGQTGNPLTSFNWYGNWTNGATGLTEGAINFANSDCGYGIGQITTGMCISGSTTSQGACTSPLSAQQQTAVAIDYQANIAASARVLEQAWNQLEAAGILANGGDPQYIENWYFAAWAYNSGIEPTAKFGNTTGCTPGPACTDAGGNWGLGWANNPANMAYAPDRPTFGSSSGKVDPDGSLYAASWDLAHPQYWPYQEKIIGWAFNGFTAPNFLHADFEQAYPFGTWPADATDPALPGLTALCTADNHCNPAVITGGSATQSVDACQLADPLSDHCWWHQPATWTICADTCGKGVASYPAGAADPGNPGVPAGYPPRCTTGLPAGTTIVDDTRFAAVLGCPGQNYASSGTMSFTFGQAADGSLPSKMDFHQIGAGLGGHFWYTHTIDNNDVTGRSLTGAFTTDTADLKITGTWTPPAMTGWTRIMAHIPNYGAWDPQAQYQISPGGGAAVQRRVVNQATQLNQWVSLGLYNLSTGASVSLNNISYNVQGWDVAWDAMAFIPSSPPGTNYVAMGDSYSSGESITPFDHDSDYNFNSMVDGCHRAGSTSSQKAYSQLVTLPGQTATIAGQAGAPGFGTSYTFIACSGDVTTGIAEAAASAPMMANTPWDGLHLGYEEFVQDDTGWLNNQTTLVTLTAGGDDARFTPVLEACLVDVVRQCTDSDFFMKYTNGAFDPAPLTTYEPEVISALESHLEDVYAAIAQRAPNAEIIVLGYPRLFPADAGANCIATPAVMSFLNSMGDDLNQTIAGAVHQEALNGANIHFVNPDSPGDGTTGFTGHEICTPQPWINAIIASQTSGSGTTAPGAGSFHPKQEGQQEFAKLVNECLASTISC